MQREFKPIVEELEKYLRSFFAERIVSAYLHGSIDKQDAIPGLSDLDYFLLVSDACLQEDESWINEMVCGLQEKYREVNEIHLMVKTVDALLDDPFTRFILTQNATLRMGCPIESIDEYKTCVWYSPNTKIAKMRLAFARACFQDALNGMQPACTGGIPGNTYYAARKYARYFVVVEGAYFLMTRNMYRGFDRECVLSGLKKEAPQYELEINMTERVLLDSIETEMGGDLFLHMIKPLVEWMFDEIENASE